MKPLTLSGFICLSFVLILFSCKKDHTPAPPADNIIHVNYLYLATSFQVNNDSVKQVEIIVNEDNGKVLLDTIAAVNTNIVADLKTRAKSFDLTVIRYRPVAKAFYLTTDKAINPADWTILPGSDSLYNTPSLTRPGISPGLAYYTHVPVNGPEYYIYSSPRSNGSGTYLFPAGGALRLPFYMEQNADVYLAFPNRALYNFHHMTTTSDTIDLSTMDTAVRIRVARPAQYPNFQASLSGFVDSTDPAKVIFISSHNTGIDTIAGADLIYPAKHIFQKYSYLITAQDASKTTSSNYEDFWTDTVNANPTFIDDSYYSISAFTNNDFVVNFPRLAPGYYLTVWNTHSLYWTLYAPSDSTALHPLDLLTSLKSKLLAGQDLTGMKIDNFAFSYQLDRHKQPVPVKLTPQDNKYQALPGKPSITTLSRIWN